MIKDTLKQIARSFGVNFCSTDHLGVYVELDLARLTSEDPLQTIFDVGANFGQTALLYSSIFPTAEIYSFEPVPTSFSQLQKAVRPNQNIKPFNLALGDTSGTIPINLMPDPGWNSIFPNQTATGSIEVQIDTLDSFVAAHSLKKIDLLKIDVEGYELQVLKGAEQLQQSVRQNHQYLACLN